MLKPVMRSDSDFEMDVVQNQYDTFLLRKQDLRFAVICSFRKITTSIRGTQEVRSMHDLLANSRRRMLRSQSSATGRRLFAAKLTHSGNVAKTSVKTQKPKKTKNKIAQTMG